MSDYQFQSTSYRTQWDMLRAIAESWLDAGGKNTLADQREALEALSDRDLAIECIAGWGFDQPCDDYVTRYNFDDDDRPRPESHMDRHSYGADELAEAFAARRAEIEAMPVEESE